MQRLGQIGLGKISVLATILCVLGTLAVFGQSMFSSGPLSEQNPRKIARGGVSSHAEIRSCSACHAPAWSSDTMATRCMTCHDNIRDQLSNGKAMHGLLTNGDDCRSCHTEHKGSAGKLTSFALFDHECTAFKLVGRHRQVECAACHHDQPFQGTPQTCAACHAEPMTHQGKFGNDCATCHSPQTWHTPFTSDLFTSSKFDHANTGFPLSGKHAALDCKSCHKSGPGNAFKGLSQSCVSCHAEPVVHKGKFGTDCKSCHGSLDWKSINFKKDTFTSIKFDHDTTGFKLTGKHASADCKSCHTGNTFKGTPTSCVSCHAEPMNHKPHPKSFGQSCAECHATTSWKGATLVKLHAFPMNHRSGKRGMAGGNHACIVCHKDTITTNFVATPPVKTLSYATYTCYGCHAHTPEREAQRHQNRKGVTQLNLPKCATCHKTGRGHERRANDVPFDREFAFLCPESSDPCMTLSTACTTPSRVDVIPIADTPSASFEMRGLPRFDPRDWLPSNRTFLK